MDLSRYRIVQGHDAGDYTLALYRDALGREVNDVAMSRYLTALGKHDYDIDRTVPQSPEFNRCQVEAANVGVPNAGDRTNPWRPWCNVVPRFVMVSLDAPAVDPVTFTVEVEGREIASVTVETGNLFQREDLADAIGFGVAEALQVVADTPGSGYTSATITTVVDAPPQAFLSGTLIFPAPATVDFTEFGHNSGGG